MEISFLDLKEKEVINVFNGKKLGRIIDIVFNSANGEVLGLVVPGDKKFIRRGDDVFIPLDKLKRIGNDVILVGLQTEGFYPNAKTSEVSKYRNYSEGKVFTSQQNLRANTYMQNNSYQMMQSKMHEDALHGKSYVRIKPLAPNKYK